MGRIGFALLVAAGCYGPELESPDVPFDRSINPYNPFLGMQTAITRKARWYDGKLHPEEALTREQAIQFYTINNARLLFCEETRGSLEVGKLADLVVLDTDLLKCPEEKIASTRVLRTYIGGKLMHNAEAQ